MQSKWDDFAENDFETQFAVTRLLLTLLFESGFAVPYDAPVNYTERVPPMQIKFTSSNERKSRDVNKLLQGTLPPFFKLIDFFSNFVADCILPVEYHKLQCTRNWYPNLFSRFE